MNKDHQELSDLIQACLDGRATDEQAEHFNARLRSDAAARDLYLQLADTHSCLAVDESLWMDDFVNARAPARQVSERWLNWRPIAAAAAGLIIGAFSATAVWAIASVKSPGVHEKVPLADAGFEAGVSIPSGSVPQHPGEWSGDPCAIVEAQGLVHPREGRHMLRFLAASTTGDFAGSKNMAADLWQVIALPGNGARAVKIRAWFNADTDKQTRFHIAAVAGANAKDLWEQRSSDGGSMAFSRSMIFVDQNPKTWEAGELTLQVPPQARVLIIGIAAYRLPVEAPQEWFPSQFVDDVSVTISEEVLP